MRCSLVAGGPADFDENFQVYGVRKVCRQMQRERGRLLDHDIMLKGM